MKKLTDDVAALKPSLFVAVPRVLERIQSGIVMKLKQKNWLVRFVFNLAYKWKLWAIKSGKPVDKVSSWGRSRHYLIHTSHARCSCGSGFPDPNTASASISAVSQSVR